MHLSSKSHLDKLELMETRQKKVHSQELVIKWEKNYIRE